MFCCRPHVLSEEYPDLTSRKSKMQITKRLKRILPVLALTSAVALTGMAWAVSHSSPGVEVEVEGSVQDVIGKLQTMVGSNGMMVMGELHQGRVLAMTGLSVESESIFVGSPTVGKELFSADPAAGLVVPMRINVYANADGQTIMAYIPPSRLLSEFKNQKINEIATMLDGKFQMMTQALTR